MSNFFTGFMKRAAENVEKAMPESKKAPTKGAPVEKASKETDADAELGSEIPAEPGEKMLKFNDQGGVDPRSPEAMAQAQAVNLITLPKGVEGANCSNCIHFRALDKKKGSGFCTNPEVQQDTTEKMVCGRWDNVGVHKSWEAFDGADVPPGDMMQAAEQGLGMQAQGLDPATGQPMVDPATGQPMAPPAGGDVDPATGQPMAQGQGGEKKPPAEKKKPAAKKDSGEKSEPKDGNTINIHVGGEKAKTEKKAGLARAAMEGLTGVSDLGAESLIRRAGKGVRRAAAPAVAGTGAAVAVGHHKKEASGATRELYRHRKDVINALGVGSAAVGAAASVRSAKAAERAMSSIESDGKKK